MAPHNLVFQAVQPTSAFSKILLHPYECERLMSYLVDPTSPSRSVYDYVVALKDRFEERSEAIEKKRALVGHKKFEKIALSSGIVKTFFQIAKNGRTDMEGVFTSYFAAEALWGLIVIGTLEERRRLVKVFVEEHDVIDWCLELASSAPFVCHRAICMMGLRRLITQCYLYEYLTIAKASELMRTLCRCILSGPGVWVNQLGDPATTWQSLFCFGTVGTPTLKARSYAPRYYSLYQEQAAWSMIELVGRYPLPEQQYYNDLIKHDPTLLDLLFECSLVKREAWYAQLEVDVRTIEIVIFMLNLPVEMIPGPTPEVDDQVIRERLSRRWNALMEGVSLLVARPNWCQRIIDTWKHIFEERPSKIHEMLKKAQRDHHAMEPYAVEGFMSVMRQRGNFRIVVLRLVTTIAYASETHLESISDMDLLNLFHIGYAGCQPVRTAAEVKDAESLDDSAEVIERMSVAYHRAGKMDPTMMNGTEEHVLQINDEAITGPICHIRLLIALTKRGLLEKIPQWETSPEGLNVPWGLQILKKLVSEAEVRRSVGLSVRRLVDRREIGNNALRQNGQLESARIEYWFAAQLAAALIDFDRVSNGKYADLIAVSKKELVLNLGNAAEMSLGQEYFDRALVFASSAVNAANECSGNDAIDQSVREKNERRVRRAEEGIARARG